MSTKKLMKFILKLESELEIDKFVVEGVNIWPMLRAEIYILWFLKYVSTGEDERHRPLLKNLRTKFWFFMSFFRRFVGSFSSKIFAGKMFPSSAFWFFSKGLEYQVLPNGRKYEKFCMPLAAASRKLGQKTVIIDTLNSSTSNCNEPVFSWAFEVSYAKAYGLVKSIASDHSEIRWIITRVNNELENDEKNYVHLNMIKMSAKIYAVLKLSQMMTKVFTRYDAKAAFVVCYYSVLGYAMSIAARNCSIPSVDIQHGSITNGHPAYAKLKPVPSDQISIYPDVVFTWSDAELLVIGNDDANHIARRPIPISSAHPFNCSWRSGLIPGASLADRVLKNILKSHPGERNILVSMQPKLCGPGPLKPLLTSMIETKNVCWWVRLHPNALGDKSYVVDLLSTYGITNYLVDECTELPLTAVLSVVDLHVSHGSSTVIEALAAQVPSILWNKYGADQYLGLGSDWMISYGLNTQNIEAVLSRLDTARESSQSHKPCGNKLEEAINLFIDKFYITD